MNKINLKNYEAYFLDFSEGNLSQTELEELRRFLNQHPQLKKELEDFEQPLLAAEQSFDNSFKTQLYREETTGLPVADYLMVAQVEETISTTEKKQLAELIKDDDALLSDLAIYHKTKLAADEKILFPDKKALLEEDNKFALWIKVASAAAAAVFIISLSNIKLADEQYRPTQFSYSAILVDDQKTETLQQASLPQVSKPITPNIKNTALPHSIRNSNSTQLAERVKVSKIQALAFQPIKSAVSTPKTIEKSVKKVEIMPLKTSEAELVAQNTEALSSEEFPTLKKIAGQKIKTDLLKNKSLKDAIIEELADLSDNRLSLAETQEGKAQRFAINLGKFSYSNF